MFIEREVAESPDAEITPIDETELEKVPSNAPQQTVMQEEPHNET